MPENEEILFNKKGIIFIDGNYINIRIKKYVEKYSQNSNKVKVDYAKIIKQISLMVGKTEVLRTYYYNAPPFDDKTNKYEELKSGFDKFINKLEKIPFFETKMGRTQKLTDKVGNPVFTQKGVDVNLAIDLVKWSYQQNINSLIIISGDSDFVPAITLAKDMGKLVYLFTSDDTSYTDNLINISDKHFMIDDEFLSKCI